MKAQEIQDAKNEMNSILKTTLNLNDKVTVQLTQAGIEHYREHYREFIMDLYLDPDEYTSASIDAEGFMTTTLWHLMSTFGSGICMGCDQMFKDNKIIISN